MELYSLLTSTSTSFSSTYLSSVPISLISSDATSAPRTTIVNYAMSGSLAFSSPNPFASSSRPPRNLDEPLGFTKDYRLLTNWYNFHRSSGSTTIQRLQLRKEHVTPFHEFVMVLTQAGYMYRVDRGRKGPVLDALRKQGVPPVDTIALLRLTSLDDLDGTSYCAIELCWGSDKTIDLKLVLDICFQIHNNSGKRYKLLTHNCYFFAQTIIMITVRKTVTCKLDKMLRDMLKSDILWRVTRRAAIVITGTVLQLKQFYFGQKVFPQLGKQPNLQMKLRMIMIGLWWKHQQKREREWELELELKLKLKQELEWELELELERERELGLVWGRGQELERELERELELGLVRVRELELERAWERERLHLGVREGAREQQQWEGSGVRERRERKREREWERERERRWKWREELKQNLDRAWEGGERPRVLELELAMARVQVQDWMQNYVWKGGVLGGAGGNLGRQLGWELGWELGEQLGLTFGEQLGKLVGKQLGKQLGEHLGEKLEPQFLLCLMLQRLDHQVFQHLYTLELMLSQQALEEVLQLGLIGELELGWHRNCPGFSVYEHANVSDHAGRWAKWLIENLGKIVIHALQQEPLLGCFFSRLFEFHSSFSALSKLNAKAPNVAIETFKDLEDYMKGIIDRHVESVPPGLGSREELRAEILSGMTATWHLVSPQFQRRW